MKRNVSFKVGLTFSLLPLLFLVGCICVYINGSYILNFEILAFPLGLIAVSLVFCLIKKMPSFLKCAVPILLFILSFAYYGLLFMSGHEEFRVYDSLEEMEEYNGSLEGKPSYELFDSPEIDIAEYGDFSDIAYYKYHFHSIFADLAHTVIAQYTQENFEKTVKDIEDKYSFAKASVKEEDPVPVFSLEDFDFRLISHEYLTESYPKSLSFIGINEKTREIAYVSFENMDLDSISDFSDFMSRACGWRYIMKER